jgi:Ca-activated chloride channel family protein
VAEVVRLAKRYGITTPYTSYLVVPDMGTPGPVVRGGMGGGLGGPAWRVPAGVAPPKGAPAKPGEVEKFARRAESLESRRATHAADELKEAEGGKGKEEPKAVAEARKKLGVYRRARELLKRGDKDGVHSGKFGVDLTLEMNDLRRGTRLERSAVQCVLGRNCLEVAGVWIDEGFGVKTPAVVVRAQSDAYFRILERHPKVRKVYQLGNHVVWVTPSGTALVIDAGHGKARLSDGEIDKLFVVKK